MIYRIEDDFDHLGNVGESNSLSWADCPMSRRPTCLGDGGKGKPGRPSGEHVLERFAVWITCIRSDYYRSFVYKGTK
jgi:hypothetical protein